MFFVLIYYSNLYILLRKALKSTSIPSIFCFAAQLIDLIWKYTLVSLWEVVLQ